MKKISNDYIREQLNNGNLLIKYVRNDAGMKYATIIAIKDSKGIHIGASVIDRVDYEYSWKSGVPMLDKLDTLTAFYVKKYFNDTLKVSLKDVDMHLNRPVFNREKGILQAIKNSRKEWFTYDSKVNGAIAAMENRASIWFSEEA